jgi:hypothetical protein
MPSSRLPDNPPNLNETGRMTRQSDRGGLADSSSEAERGLRDDVPGFSWVAASAGLGGFWGLVGYTILWEGAPVQVNRAFVESAAGTLALLPVRLVIWSIHLAEELAGRTFDLSRSYLWIGFVASVVGAALAVAGFLLARGLMVRATRAGPPRPGRR